ncbi:MAG TPA: hypothetical protein EYO87_14015, partial [Paracoccus sp.]|nr:hypothetical protein [Paracoccus sp. (in: a-proteobacteria)]
MTGFLRFMPLTLGLAVLAALIVIVAGTITNPVAALALPVGLFSGLLLFAQPFLGVLALTVFSHLDAIQKLFFGFLPVSAFKLIAAGTSLVVLARAIDMRNSIRTAARDPVAMFAFLTTGMAVVSIV